MKNVNFHIVEAKNTNRVESYRKDKEGEEYSFSSRDALIRGTDVVDDIFVKENLEAIYRLMKENLEAIYRHTRAIEKHILTPDTRIHVRLFTAADVDVPPVKEDQ